MSTERDTFVQQRLQSQRILAGALLGSLVIFGVVAVIVLGIEDYPSPLLAGGLFLLNLLVFAATEAIGYRTPAIAPGTDKPEAVRQGLDAMQQTMTLRFALTEAPALLALAGAFVTESAWTYLVGGFWALLAMAWHVWPSRRVATKLERSLDREGGRSGLTALLGGTSAPGYQQY